MIILHPLPGVAVLPFPNYFVCPLPGVTVLPFPHHLACPLSFFFNFWLPSPFSSFKLSSDYLIIYLSINVQKIFFKLVFKSLQAATPFTSQVMSLATPKHFFVAHLVLPPHSPLRPSKCPLGGGGGIAHSRNY